MTECPLEHHTELSWPSKQPVVGDLTTTHPQLSVRGKQVLDRLLVLLPSHLGPSLTPYASSFPPALLFSICDVLQLDGDRPVLPSVLSKLRDWRLLDPNYRRSRGGVYTLALDLAGLVDSASAFPKATRCRLRMKWVSSDSPNEAPPPSPSPPRPRVLDAAQEQYCAHTLRNQDERRPDTPDSEDASAVALPRRHIVGFRSGCSACRQLRLSGRSAPPSPHMPSMPLSDINRSVPPTPARRTTNRKTGVEKHKSRSAACRVDENEPPLTKPTAGIQHDIGTSTGITFPRQRTPNYPARISNAQASRAPFSSIAASFQRRRPGADDDRLNRPREGDKHTPGHRVASVDLVLSMVHPPPNADLRPNPQFYRTRSFPAVPAHVHSVGSVAGGVPKPSSNAMVGSRSDKQLPSLSRTHPARHPTTTTTLSPSPAKTRFANAPLLPLGTRSRPSSTSIPPRSLPSDAQRHRSVSSQTHKHWSRGVLLPLSPMSPLIHARKRQT